MLFLVNLEPMNDDAKDLKGLIQKDEITLELDKSFFKEFRFKDAVKAHKNIKSAMELCDTDEASAGLFESVLSHFCLTGDPDLALVHLVRLLEKAHKPFDVLKILLKDKDKIKLVSKIFSESIYFTDIIINNPEELFWLIESDFKTIKTREELLAELFNACEKEEDDNEKLNCMRRFKNREVLRIGANDLMNITNLQTTTGEISNIADICLEYALHHQTLVCEKVHGKLSDVCSFTVISMGKLGGFELNYSSDIDIIFVCEGEGVSDKSGISYMSYYTNIAQGITKALTDVSPFGYCFRVDTRLRPEGTKGQLVRNLLSYEQYYETRGKTWERQALIKARGSAGDMALGLKFIKLVEPFIYRKYLTFTDIQAIKHLKNLIEDRVTKEGNWKTEVKLGEGGIRDIEFMVQFLQLLNGGTYKEIRTQNTLIALSRLCDVKSLTFEEVHFLEDAYVFLRNIEHRLQIYSYQQVHNLPTAPDEVEKLARQMGFLPQKGKTPAELFSAEYKEITGRVRQIFNKNFAGLFSGADEGQKVYDIIRGDEAYEEQGVKMLSEIGFDEPLNAYKILHNFSISSLKANTYFRDILPMMLKELAKSPNPDMGLVNFMKIIEAYKAHETLFEMFYDTKEALSMFLKLCAYSQFLSNILIRNPGILDLLTEPNVLDEAKKRTEVKTVLDNFLSFEIPLREAVYRLRDIEQFRIGLRNILGKCDIRTTNWELTNLAHIIIESVFRDFLEEHEREKGKCTTNWAFILAGKMGGYELGFGSDIDAIFVYEENVEVANNYYASEFFANVLSKTVHFLITPSEHGMLYELDLRLRPDGKKSAICKTLDGVKKYYSKKGEVWERLFLSKSRVISSSRAFAIKVNSEIKRFVFSRIKAETLRSETIAMRKKIADAEKVKQKEKTYLSFKKWYGGLLDIEFLAEYLIILYARKDTLIRKNNTVSMIKALAKHFCIEDQDEHNLIDAYKFLRNIENILRIVHNYQADTLPESEKDYRLLMQRLGLEGSDKESFFEKYNEYSFLIKEIYFKYLGE